MGDRLTELNALANGPAIDVDGALSVVDSVLFPPPPPPPPKRATGPSIPLGSSKREWEQAIEQDAYSKPLLLSGKHVKELAGEEASMEANLRHELDLQKRQLERLRDRIRRKEIAAWKSAVQLSSIDPTDGSSSFGLRHQEDFLRRTTAEEREEKYDAASAAAEDVALEAAAYKSQLEALEATVASLEINLKSLSVDPVPSADPLAQGRPSPERGTRYSSSSNSSTARSRLSTSRAQSHDIGTGDVSPASGMEGDAYPYPNTALAAFESARKADREAVQGLLDGPAPSPVTKLSAFSPGPPPSTMLASTSPRGSTKIVPRGPLASAALPRRTAAPLLGLSFHSVGPVKLHPDEPAQTMYAVASIKNGTVLGGSATTPRYGHGTRGLQLEGVVSSISNGAISSLSPSPTPRISTAANTAHVVANSKQIPHLDSRSLLPTNTAAAVAAAAARGGPGGQAASASVFDSHPYFSPFLSQTGNTAGAAEGSRGVTGIMMTVLPERFYNTAYDLVPGGGGGSGSSTSRSNANPLQGILRHGNNGKSSAADGDYENAIESLEERLYRLEAANAVKASEAMSARILDDAKRAELRVEFLEAAHPPGPPRPKGPVKIDADLFKRIQTSPYVFKSGATPSARATPRGGPVSPSPALSTELGGKPAWNKGKIRPAPVARSLRDVLGVRSRIKAPGGGVLPGAGEVGGGSKPVWRLDQAARGGIASQRVKEQQQKAALPPLTARKTAPGPSIQEVLERRRAAEAIKAASRRTGGGGIAGSGRTVVPPTSSNRGGALSSKSAALQASSRLAVRAALRKEFGPPTSRAPITPRAPLHLRADSSSRSAAAAPGADATTSASMLGSRIASTSRTTGSAGAAANSRGIPHAGVSQKQQATVAAGPILGIKATSPLPSPKLQVAKAQKGSVAPAAPLFPVSPTVMRVPKDVSRPNAPRVLLPPTSPSLKAIAVKGLVLVGAGTAAPAAKS